MSQDHPLKQAIAGVTDEMLAQATDFLEGRRVKHGDLRMEADGDDTGGADDGGGSDGADDDSDDQDGADQLADKGKQALDRMKTQRNEFRDQLRAFQALGMTPEQIQALAAKGKPADGDQPDADAIRQQIRAEVTAEANRDRVIDKIEAKAARDFADPEDAVAILLRSRKADDFLNGDAIDVEEIEDALKALLKNKPHLAAQGRRFQGGADGGARKETAKSEPKPGLDRLRAAYADSK